MERKIHIFDAIEENKRKSLLLLAFLSIFYFFVSWLLFMVLSGDNAVSIIFSLIVVIVYSLIIFSKGKDLILFMEGAKKLPKRYVYIHHIVEGLALAAGLPKVPDIYYIPAEGINAFAVGKDPKDAAIVLTKGALEKLNRRELAGVIAHEISHIANYDVRYMLIAVVFASAMGMVSELFLRSLRYSGRSRRRGGAGILILIALFVSVVAPIITELVKFAISRQREYLADANAAKLTRDPKGLAMALEKIKKLGSKVPSASQAAQSLYIAKPKNNLFELTATHPPIEKRIERLLRM